MATTENLATLNALFKDQYAAKVTDALPRYSYILSEVPFVGGAEKSGRELKQPVILSRVHGHTALGTDDGQLDLREPTTAVNDVASVKSCAYVSRQFISNTVLARATGSAQSFVEATAYVVQNLQESAAHMLEVAHLYGQAGLATISSGTYADSTVDGVVFTDGVNVASKALLISKETLAEGVWVGAENMPIEIYTGSTLSQACVITAVDPVNGILYVDSVAALAADPQGFKIFRAGFKDVEVPGLETMLSNTGTLFGINSATKRLWRANQADAAGALTFNVVQAAVSRSIGRGLADRMDLHVNPRVFSTLVPDFNTVKDTGTAFKSRVFNSQEDVKDLAHGAEKIRFFVAGHETTLVSNPMVKAGLAMGLEDGVLVRVGSTKLTFDIPGSEQVYFRPLEGKAASELRMFADESIFSRKMNGHLIISGITY